MPYSQTGYPSVDRPWMKFYNVKDTSEDNAQVRKCLYSYLKDENWDHLEETALYYFGKKISYSSLFKRIDKTAEAFSALGVVDGDMVSLCVVSMPETAYCCFALNKLGSVCNIIEPRTNANRIVELIKKSQSKVLVIVDVILKKLRDRLDETGVETVIIIPISESMPFIKKKLYDVTKSQYNSRISCNKHIMNWADFQKKSGNSVNCVGFKKKRPAVIIYTGGTTGVPKGAILSNEGIVSLAVQSKYVVPRLYEGKRFLGIMPPFIAYGFVFGLFIPLCAGLELVMIPNFSPKLFPELMVKYKPNHVVGVPSFFEDFVNSKASQKIDLSFLMCAITGGDQLTESTENKINEFFLSHNCKYRIMKGYGMTELGSAVTFSHTNESNKPGSVGIPIPCSNMKVLDQQTGKELKYNEVGELCITSDSIMLEYFNNPSETAKAKILHDDGKYWIHSGDIGYISEEGLCYIKGRIKRMIIRPDGHNVWPSNIEDVICMHPAVAACAVVGRAPEKTVNGKVPTAFIVNKPNQKKSQELLSDIEKFTKIHLGERDTASLYVFIDELPLTDIGKVDYQKLETIAI